MFDKVLKPNITQEQVYNGAAKHIVKGNVCLSYFLNLTVLTSFSLFSFELRICNQSVLTRFLL